MLILGIRTLVFRGVIVWPKGEELDQGLEQKCPRVKTSQKQVDETIIGKSPRNKCIANQPKKGT